MNPDMISCIILAGGLARRMGGVDKGLLDYRGRQLVTHVIESISPQVDDIIISANRNIDRYQAMGYPVVTDNNHHFDGPLAGIASSIPHCKHDWIVVTPCDMPSLPPDLVSTLAQHASQSRLIVISSNQRLQLLFLLHRSLLESIESYLSTIQNSVIHWIDTNDYHSVPIDNQNYLSNINTSNQLA